MERSGATTLRGNPLTLIGPELKPGDDAPDFTLKDQNKQPWTLSEALERGPVVLSFYPMAFSSVCSAEGAHQVPGASQVNFWPCRRGRPPRPPRVGARGGGSA